MSLPGRHVKWLDPMIRTDADACRRPRAFVLILVMHAVNLLVTWPLWQVRASVPMLPMWEGPEWDLGPGLLVSLSVCLFAPRVGLALHVVLLALAMSLDQMRLQPPVISHVILLWSLSGGATGRAIGRAHLIALWFYAGLFKLLSPGFMTGEARWIVQQFVPGAPVWGEQLFGILVASGEMGLAVWAVIPTTRQFASRAAVALHLGVVLMLSPVGLNWDPAVWSWNISLAIAAVALIGSWTSGSVRQLTQPSWLNRVTMAAAALLLLLPSGYLMGFSETYLCHLLYSSHVPRGWVVNTDGGVEPIDTRPWLNVPVPQIARLYEAHFRQLDRRSTALIIEDPRSGRTMIRRESPVPPAGRLGRAVLGAN